MATIRQIEANRLNSKKSTGPSSVEGKSRSSMNALKTGVHAASEIIPGESAADLAALAKEYTRRFQPSTPEQRFLVDTLVRADWELRRLGRAEAQIWQYRGRARVFPEKDAGGLANVLLYCGSSLNHLQRRIDAAHRNYHRALTELQRLQSPPPTPTPKPMQNKPVTQSVAPQIGFVPSRQPSAPRYTENTPPGLDQVPCPPPSSTCTAIPITRSSTARVKYRS